MQAGMVFSRRLETGNRSSSSCHAFAGAAADVVSQTKCWALVRNYGYDDLADEDIDCNEILELRHSA